MIEPKLPGMPRTPLEQLAELIADSDTPTPEQTAQARLWLSWLTPKIEAGVMRREKVGVVTFWRGDEGCMPGEWDCEDYYDGNGNQLPDVECCGHIEDDVWDADRLLELIARAEAESERADHWMEEAYRLHGAVWEKPLDAAGRWVCKVCREPVEDGPCQEHDPTLHPSFVLALGGE